MRAVQWIRILVVGVVAAATVVVASPAAAAPHPHAAPAQPLFSDLGAYSTLGMPVGVSSDDRVAVQKGAWQDGTFTPVPADAGSIVIGMSADGTAIVRGAEDSAYHFFGVRHAEWYADGSVHQVPPDCSDSRYDYYPVDVTAVGANGTIAGYTYLTCGPAVSYALASVSGTWVATSLSIVDGVNQDFVFGWDQASSTYRIAGRSGGIGSVVPVAPQKDGGQLADDGSVVGELVDSNLQQDGKHAVSVDATGAVTPLKAPDGDYVLARAQNDQHVVVGSVTDASSVAQAVKWATPTSQPTLLTDAAGVPTDWTLQTAIAINATGDIVGTGTAPDGTTHDYLLRAAQTPPPVVNSIGDAAAKSSGKSGCDTGQTVTVNGSPKPECTLRAALQAENAGTVEQKSITFSTTLTASSPAVITPATALPTLTAAGTTVDFASGATGGSTVELVGSGTSIGLDVKASGVTIKGLRVHGFATGLLLEGPGHDTVLGSELGKGSGGDAADRTGIEITSPGNAIGDGTAGGRNVIAGDSYFGVYVHGTSATGTKIAGNYVGVLADGQTEATNSIGVLVRDASESVIGGSTSTPGTNAGNLFNGSGTPDGAVDVVGISAKVTGTVIAGNSFGLAADGTTQFKDSCHQEIAVLGSTEGTVIGGGSGSGNVVDGFCEREIVVNSVDTSGTRILGNRIGTDLSGTHELAGFTIDNTATAIGVSGATHTTIGQVGQGNTIVGGFGSGIETQLVVAAATISYPSSTPIPGTGTTLKGASGAVVSGNSIGVLADTATMKAIGAGVIVTGSGDSVSHNQIASTPIAITVDKATGAETVSANLLGVTAGGTGALPLGYGVAVNASAKAVVTGNTVAATATAIAVTASPNVQVNSNKIDVTASGNGPLTAYTGPLPESWATATAGLKQLGIAVDNTTTSALVRGNVIGTVAGPGVVLDGATSTIDDNHIGVGLDGVTKIGNTGDGIDVAADSVTIGAAGTGSTLTGVGNVVANNGGAGVNVAVNHAKVAIRSNSIHDNTNGAIVLSGNANSHIPALQRSSAVQDGKGHTVVFVHAPAGSTVQVFAAANCTTEPDADPDTPAQGLTLLATATVDASGFANIPVALQAVGTFIDTTDTVATFGTSQFSGCTPVFASANGSVKTPTTQPGKPDTGGGSGFAPEEAVTGSIHSTPVSLGTKSADANGSVSFAFTVPTTLAAGTHYLLLQGPSHAVAVPFTVHTVAAAPRSTKALAGKAIVTLTWAAPMSSGGVTVTGYQVLRSSDKKHWSMRATVKTGRYVDKGLHGGTRYYYEVRALNAVGVSAVSPAVSAVPYAVASAPRALHAKAEVKAATLTWSAPASSHGATITSYVVEYAGCRLGSRGCRAHIVNVSGRALTVRRLVVGKRYYFAVLAVNKAGRSPLSSQVSTTPRK